MWATLINSLIDKPENYPIVRARQVETDAGREAKRLQTENLELNILRAVKHLKEAHVQDIHYQVPTHTQKYLSSILNRMGFKGLLEFRYKSECKRRYKYWRLS